MKINGINREWQFVAVWRYEIAPGMEAPFEQAYGREGDWVRLFQKDEAYIGTELVRDLKADRTYLTFDFWASAEAYESFRRRYAAEYKVIDQKCAALTLKESEIGRFHRVAG